MGWYDEHLQGGYREIYYGKWNRMKTKKCIVVIGENQILESVQVAILQEKYYQIDYMIVVPGEELSLDKICVISKELLAGDSDVIMSYQIPVLLMKLAREVGYNRGFANVYDYMGDYHGLEVYTFHNDKTLQAFDGIRSHTIPDPDTWVLV